MMTKSVLWKGVHKWRVWQSRSHTLLLGNVVQSINLAFMALCSVIYFTCTCNFIA